jgi:hypothetical protein
VIQVGPGPDHLGGATAPERVRRHRHVQGHTSGVASSLKLMAESS